MMSIDNITLDSVNLPPDMVWEGEYNWSPVKAKKEIAIAGNLIIQRDLQQAGRPIVLKSTDDTAWVRRATLDVLAVLRDNPTQPNMTLTLPDGRSFLVQFDQSESSPIEAIPMQPGKIADDGDWFMVTLKFLQVG